MKTKIQFFPITAFAVVMGLAGLSIAFGKFFHLQWLPKIFFDITVFLVLILFLILVIFYSLKMMHYANEVKTDFRHRIRINFFSTISISILLLAIIFYSYYPLLAIPLWWMGVILHTLFMFKTISFWIQHNFEIQHFNPAWFIPVVGSILIPIIGVDIAPLLLSYFFFIIGFFFWIILFSIFIYRAVFHAQLPEKFIPTLFILIAPPAVGFIAYIRLTSSWDNFSIFLLFIAYFFIILLITMYKSFTKIKFYMSWWAFTFPLAASTIASSVAFQITQLSEFHIISWLMLSITIIAISIVARQTFIHIQKNEICVKED